MKSSSSRNTRVQVQSCLWFRNVTVTLVPGHKLIPGYHVVVLQLSSHVVQWSYGPLDSWFSGPMVQSSQGLVVHDQQIFGLLEQWTMVPQHRGITGTLSMTLSRQPPNKSQFMMMMAKHVNSGKLDDNKEAVIRSFELVRYFSDSQRKCVPFFSIRGYLLKRLKNQMLLTGLYLYIFIFTV